MNLKSLSAAGFMSLVATVGGPAHALTSHTNGKTLTEDMEKCLSKVTPYNGNDKVLFSKGENQVNCALYARGEEGTGDNMVATFGNRAPGRKDWIRIVNNFNNNFEVYYIDDDHDVYALSENDGSLATHWDVNKKAMVPNGIVMPKEAPTWSVSKTGIGGKKHSLANDPPPSEAKAALEAGRDLRDYLLSRKWNVKLLRTVPKPN